MNTDEFEELAPRIEGIARAVLQLAFALEKQGVIDGPRLSRAWRGDLRQAERPDLVRARKTLEELATALDALRSRHQ